MLSKDPHSSHRRLRPWVTFIALALVAGLLLALFVRPAIRLHWSTENELDVTGYNVYRSELEQGPFIRLNQSLLPPAPDAVIGGEHTFVDSAVRWGRAYYYQLETIDRSGNQTRSDMIRLRPKLGLALP